MTDYTEAPEAEVVADLAAAAAIETRKLVTVVDGWLTAAIVPPGYEVHPFDLKEFAPRPLRKTGAVVLKDPDSFAEYVNRHKNQDATTLWGDVDLGKMTAVLDDHEQDIDAEGVYRSPGWGEHRAHLQLKVTEDWAHWAKLDGKYTDQTTFAEHIEDGYLPIVRPSAADMLEIAQTFKATKKVNFQSSTRLASGEVGILWEEAVDGKAGKRGRLDIPTEFALKLAPWEGCESYELTARFRYRILDGGVLQLGYKLIRPDIVQRKAFDDLAAAVTEAVGLPLLTGAPRQR